MPEGYEVSAKDPNLRIYEPDVVLIQEDSEDDGCIYILQEGVLGVFKGKDQVAEIEGADIVIGEMSAILHTPRTATIKTMETWDERGDPVEVKVSVFTGGLQKIVEEAPHIAVRIMELVGKRLQDQTNLHRDDLGRIDKIEQMLAKSRKQMRGLKQEGDEWKAKYQALVEEQSKKKGFLGLFK